MEKKKLDTKEFLRNQQETKLSEGYNLINEAKLMWINPTPSVIMPMTHWRCQLGQSQELGQRSLKKH
jgi:hypothetical protein